MIYKKQFVEWSPTVPGEKNEFSLLGGEASLNGTIRMYEAFPAKNDFSPNNV